ncbi:MAG: hypothetical protein NZM25_01005 [Leptospiraceae bacterium]|nr:hypothetical protein [Leptospiraceae bacterium]MDW8306302.1 hypothetical protein [Leptospiraceae bacterium]
MEYNLSPRDAKIYVKREKTSASQRKTTKDMLYLDPRPIRHTERMSDLFYVLFRREKP